MTKSAAYSDPGRQTDRVNAQVSQAAASIAPPRHRLALLALGAVGDLSMVLNALDIAGFGGDRFCVFGQPAVLALMQRLRTFEMLTGSSYVTLVTSAQTCVQLSDGARCEARCGAYAQKLFRRIDSETYGADWMPADMARVIGSAIADGKLILMVRSDDARQHASGARLLLAHGTSTLVTHEFSITHPA